MALYTSYRAEATIRDRLDCWDATARRSTGGAASSPLLVLWPAARDASISGSTGIEGNPLTPEQVESVLAGAAVDASDVHILEVQNYNRALTYAREAAQRSDFGWSHELIHGINARVMEGLPRDTHGAFRGFGEPVIVGTYRGPDPLVVWSLMDELVEWLQRDVSSPLVRSALLHLNLIAIHPFNDGNGRTARILAAVELARNDVRDVELISVEAYLRRHRTDYIAALQRTLGTTYDPENHPVTEWLDYYTQIALDRLEVRNRVLDALPHDVGLLFAALDAAGEPLDWVGPLLMARIGRLRTRTLTGLTGRSAPVARAQLGAMAAAGWLEPVGATRGRWYAPASRLRAVDLRVPDMMRRLADGQ